LSAKVPSAEYRSIMGTGLSYLVWRSKGVVIAAL